MKKVNKRREFLGNSTKLAGGILLTPHFNILSSKPSLGKNLIGHGDFKYRVHKEWGNLDPSKTPVNNCHEMVMDSKGRLVMVGG